MKISEIMEVLEKIAPSQTAEEWDNTGLLIGDPDSETMRILLCLDVTDAVLRHAEKTKTGLCISHHPLIYDPVRRLDISDP